MLRKEGVGTSDEQRKLKNLNLKNFYRVVLEIFPFLGSQIEYIYFRIFLVNNSICKNDKLTKVTFPKPVPKNLKDAFSLISFTTYE